MRKLKRGHKSQLVFKEALDEEGVCLSGVNCTQLLSSGLPRFYLQSVYSIGRRWGKYYYFHDFLFVLLHR